MNPPRPTGITLNKETKQLIIQWSDNKSCTYPLPLIREACPCVQCRGGHHHMGMQKAPQSLDILTLTPARSYVLERIEIVGNYAIQLFWDDGHHTGIYTWQYLYHLCPSDELTKISDISEVNNKTDV